MCGDSPDTALAVSRACRCETRNTHKARRLRYGQPRQGTSQSGSLAAPVAFPRRRGSLRPDPKGRGSLHATPPQRATQGVAASPAISGVPTPLCTGTLPPVPGQPEQNDVKVPTVRV